LDFVFGNFSRRFRNGDILVAFDGESRDELKHRSHMQRGPVFNRQFRHLGLAHRGYAEVAHRLVEAFGQEAVNHILANLVGEAPLDDGFRNFAGAEPVNPGMLLIIARDSAERL
jgi:hypothetical protein